MKGIEGKSVIVTAGAQGIGQTIARTFLSLGAKVAICDLDKSQLAKTQQDYPALLTLGCDMASQRDVNIFFDTVDSRFGGIDILINNAGIAGPTGLLEDLKFEDWQRCIDVNINSVFLASRRALPHMKKQGHGSIVNIASTAGMFAFPARAPYAASKWAMIGITKTIAMEAGIHGIRANAIAPGSINNARMEGVIEREAERLGVPKAQIRQAYTDQTALRTFIDPEEIADMAVFLCSDLAKSISGQVIAVDGYAETLVTTPVS